MEREILHVDCNKFYASVECYMNPELRDKPVAVGGDERLRHGVILTKNEIASKYNLVVGEPLWQARLKCPQLIILQPNFPLYIEFSKKVHKILEDYTDLIEPFGLDECWLDVTGDYRKSGYEIADEIRRRVKDEVGITVSVGLSYNKIFAKLGSDYKKPDAVTIITRDNYKDIVWPLACENLLMVGEATKKKLNFYGIYTIGELAEASEDLLKNILGKNGVMLKRYANGLDMSAVRHMDVTREIKSIGNSVTTFRDLVNDTDVKIVFTTLADSVSRRMREHNIKGQTLVISVRNTQLITFNRRCKMQYPVNVSNELVKTAMQLFKSCYKWDMPIRSLGLSVTDFDYDTPLQFDISGTLERIEKREKLEATLDRLKDKYGDFCVQKARVLFDEKLSRLTPFEEHDFCPFSAVNT